MGIESPIKAFKGTLAEIKFDRIRFLQNKFRTTTRNTKLKVTRGPGRIPGKNPRQRGIGPKGMPRGENLWGN